MSNFQRYNSVCHPRDSQSATETKASDQAQKMIQFDIFIFYFKQPNPIDSKLFVEIRDSFYFNICCFSFEIFGKLNTNIKPNKKEKNLLFNAFTSFQIKYDSSL